MKNKNIKRNVVLALVLLTLTLLFTGTAYASAKELELALPVQQIFKVSGNSSAKPDMTGRYKLSAVGENVPMPEGSQNGIYSFSITGAEEQAELLWTYTEQGIYTYQLNQITKDAESYLYDRSVYTITVYVKNTEDGQLVSEVIVENESGKKCGEILFTNFYQRENGGSTGTTGTSTGGKPQTGDESDVSIWSIMGISSFLLVLIISGRTQKVHKRK